MAAPAALSDLVLTAPLQAPLVLGSCSEGRASSWCPSGHVCPAQRGPPAPPPWVDLRTRPCPSGSPAPTWPRAKASVQEHIRAWRQQAWWVSRAGGAGGSGRIEHLRGPLAWVRGWEGRRERRKWEGTRREREGGGVSGLLVPVWHLGRAGSCRVREEEGVGRPEEPSFPTPSTRTVFPFRTHCRAGPAGRPAASASPAVRLCPCCCGHSHTLSISSPRL